MIDYFEQLLKLRPAIALKVCHYRDSRLARDSCRPQHSAQAEMVDEKDAAAADQLRWRPVRVRSDRAARIGKNIPRPARLANDDVRVHRASSWFYEQMIEADPFLRHRFAGED